MSGINFRDFSVIISSNISFAPFSLLFTAYYTFCNCLTVFRYLFISFPSFFFLFKLKFGRFLLTYAKAHQFFPQCVKSINWPIKAIFITIIEFLISSISFCHFLRVSITCLFLKVYYFFPFEALSILIVVISPYLSCTSKLLPFASLVLLFALSFKLCLFLCFV